MGQYRCDGHRSDAETYLGEPDAGLLGHHCQVANNGESCPTPGGMAGDSSHHRLWAGIDPGDHIVERRGIGTQRGRVLLQISSCRERGAGVGKHDDPYRRVGNGLIQMTNERGQKPLAEGVPALGVVKGDGGDPCGQGVTGRIRHLADTTACTLGLAVRR